VPIAVRAGNPDFAAGEGQAHRESAELCFVFASVFSIVAIVARDSADRAAPPGTGPATM